jgi:uncharacterized membrane protein
MNVFLWILQGVVALAFVAFGVTHAFRIEEARARPRMAWMNDIPRGLWTFIGLAEILGAIGLILPAITGVWPWLTPLAALGLGIIMLLAAGFHATRREYRVIGANLVLLALAAMVAYGRFVIVPL